MYVSWVCVCFTVGQTATQQVEIKCVLAQLVRNYRLSFASPDVVLDEVFSVTLGLKNGVRVRATPRT